MATDLELTKSTATYNNDNNKTRKCFLMAIQKIDYVDQRAFTIQGRAWELPVHKQKKIFGPLILK